MECIYVAGKDTTFECVTFIVLGGAVAAYGLLAKTFIESSKLHVLTPSDKLERYVPKGYQRFLLVALGIASVLSGIFGLVKLAGGLRLK